MVVVYTVTLVDNEGGRGIGETISVFEVVRTDPSIVVVEPLSDSGGGLGITEEIDVVIVEPTEFVVV